MFGKKTDGVLLYEEQKDEQVCFVEFQGAVMDVDDDGKIDYAPRGRIVVNISNIGAVYDHTIVIMGHKIRVMETLDEIVKKLSGR